MTLDQPGAWSWFQDPRAVDADGVTYIGFVDQTHVMIGAFDHEAQTWTTFPLREQTSTDDHNAPALGVRPDGRIIAAWGDEALFVRVSTDPGSIASWGALKVVGAAADNWAYANLMRLDVDDTWYLFGRYRTSVAGRTHALLTSADEGDTWSAPTDIIVATNRPYAKFSATSGRIDVAVTESNPNQKADNSLYHAWLDVGAGTWHGTDGTALGAPPFDVATDFTLVYDGTTTRAWVWDVAPGPVIVFPTFPSETDHRYQYAHWTGSAWDINEIAPAGGSIAEIDTEPYYSGGLILDHVDPAVVYLSRQVDPSVWTIERWVTSDSGASWHEPEVLTPNASEKNFRPVVPRGGGPVDVVWITGSYTSFLIFDTELATSPELTPAGSTPPPDPDDPGLPQVAQAQIRTRLTWLSCNLSDGAVITELPDLQGDEVSRVIGEYTSANLALPIPAVGGPDLTLAQRAQLAAQSTEPARTMIVPVVNDIPTAGFIPLTRDLGTDATVALGCVSLEGYLRHRYVRDHLWEGVDPSEIAIGLFADAEDIDGNGQGLNLIVDAPDVGLNAGRYFEAIDDETVYGALSELMDAGLIEWTIDVDWRSGFPYRIVDKIARVRLRLGRSGEPTAVFQSATFSSQGASDARYTLKAEHSGDRYGNWIVARGTGEGEDKPRSAAQIDQSALDSGAPIWEQRIQPDIYRSPLFTESEFNQYVQEQLLLHAQQELARVREGGQALEITARWDAPGARYGVDWSIGDDVLHELKGHAHPNGFNGVRRAIGFALSIQRGTIRPILQEEDA